MNRNILALLAALSLTLSLCATAGAQQRGEFEFKEGKWTALSQPAPGTADAAVYHIRQLVELNANSAALSAAKEFAKKFPTDAGNEEVLCLAGQAEMNRQRYFQAFEWFEKQLDRYPAGVLAERALKREFDIAQAFLAGKKRVVWGFIYLSAQDEGLDILQRIAEHAPGSVIAERSVMRIADYHYSQYEWALATEAYDRYVQLFKNSPRVPYALFRAAMARYLAFRGMEFDDTPLIDAAQRFTLYHDRYPEQSRKANVPQILKDIHNLRAQKLYQVAEFYRRIKQPVAQATFYKAVLTDYADTPWGVAARENLIRLGDLKPNTPQPQPQTQPFTPAGTSTQPTTTSAPSTLPTSGPTSGPTTTSAPALGPIRIEELAPTTTSAPATTSAPTSTSTPASEPTAAATTTSAPTTASSPATEPASAPATEPATQAATQTQPAASEPASEPTREPATQAATEPAASPAPQTQPTTQTQPASEPGGNDL